MITPLQLKTVFTACRNPGLWCRVFGQELGAFGITTDARLAMFLAQTGYESTHFNVLRENLAYRTIEQLRKVYPHEMTSDDVAQRYVMNPMGLANFLYAGKNGNGNIASGDGFKFRGGGLIELTGRANYAAVGKALALDLEVRPIQIQQENIAARTAGFFWKQNDLNAAADAGDFDYTTRRVNGEAMEGAADRRTFWEKLKEVMSTPTPQAVAVAARRAVPQVIDGLMDPNFNLSYARIEPDAPAASSA